MKISRKFRNAGAVFAVGMLAFVLKTEVVAQPLPVPVINDLSERQLAAGDTESSGFSQIAAGGVNEAGDEFGAVLATGDFNADGFDDLAIGAPGEDGNAGAVFIMMGGADGLSTGFFMKQNIAGGAIEAGDRFGAALAVGDFNNDGFDDLVVAAPGENSGAGTIFFWRGSVSGIAPANGTFFFANDFGCGEAEPEDEFGAALAAGDFNADGFDDLAIGAPGENDDEGRVCVVKGRSGSGIATGSGAYYSQATASLGQVEAGDRFGAALATGRFTSGSHVDLAIGAPREMPQRGGVVIVLFGSGSQQTAASGIFTSGVLLTQEDAGASTEPGDLFGSALGAGDVTGDGFSDVIVGAPGERAPSGSTGGIFFVFPGASAGPANRVGESSCMLGIKAARWYEQTGHVAGATTEDGDEFAAAIATGDFDGNGVIDVALGAPGEGPGAAPANSGMIVEFFGSAGGIDVGSWISQESTQSGARSEAGDRFGAAIAAGDFDGDGRDELAIGAPGEAPGADPAAGYVFVLKHGAYRLTHGPILGAVTHSSINVWIRGNRAAEYEVSFRPAAGGAPLEVSGGNLGAANDYTKSVQLTGLLANTLYDYKVTLGGAEVYSGTFRTLPTPSPGRVVFAYGADIHLAYRPYGAFDEAKAKGLQFMILGGDNIYADSTDPVVENTITGYRHRYRETFGDARLRAFMSDIPTLMMWDDHEICNDWYVDKDSRYPAARKAFDEYQGSHNPVPLVAGELYYTFQARNVEFFVLDTRSHRSNNYAADNASKTMLGLQQRAALFDWLETSTAKFKFIVSSVPFNPFANTGRDSWDGFSTERALILNYVRDNAIPGVVLLSGDQHWSGVFRLTLASPYIFYEFMPTPIAIHNRIEWPQDDPQILYKSNIEKDNTDQNNTERGFGLFEIDTSVVPATLTYSWISDSGDVLFSMVIDEDDIGVDELDLIGL